MPKTWYEILSKTGRTTMRDGSILSSEVDVVSISMLGPFAIRQQKKFVALGVQGLTRELLYFLFAKPNQIHRREHLMEIFWPDSNLSRARSTLNTAIWRLKQRANNLPGIDIVTIDNDICLSLANNVKVDCHGLEETMDIARAEIRDAKTLSAGTRRILSGYLKQNHGIFLEGCEAYWALVEREYFQNLILRGLYYLMQDAIDRKLLDRALSWGRHLLDADPLRESVYYDVIYLYVLTDQRAKALQLYDQLKNVLRAELGLTPNNETKALKARILSETVSLSPVRNTISPAPSPLFMPTQPLVEQC